MKWNAGRAREIIRAAGGAERLAELTGLGRRTVQRMTQRGRSPTFESAALIAEATGHPLEDFRRRT